MPDEPVAVGRVLAPHGVRGEVKVEPLTDFPERFERGGRLWADGTELLIEGSRWQGRTVLLKLRGVETRSEAEALRGQMLTVPYLAEIEEEGVYYLHDIVGARVVDESGEELGTLDEVLTTGSNDVYVIRGERGELLLPALDDVVLDVDVAGRRVTAAVPEGLEFHKSGPKPARRRPARRPRAS